MSDTQQAQGRGDGGGSPPGNFLGPAEIAAAVAWNNSHFAGAYRAELLGFLRGAAAGAGEPFGQDDVQQVARYQDDAGLATDGMLGAHTMAVLLDSGLAFSRQPAVSADAVTLQFYPGEFEDLSAWQQEIDRVVGQGGTYSQVRFPAGSGRIYVQVGQNLVGKYTARGGPPATVPDGGGHTADPTAAGTYTLGKGHPVVTPNWPFSQIAWGTQIRQVGQDYQYLADSGDWHYATGPQSDLTVPLPASAFAPLFQGKLDGGIRQWTLNDFGPLGWNLVGTADYVHTTPDSEAAAAAGRPVVLPASHGCIHVIPGERDDMMARGYLQKGVKIVVKGYDEHLYPSSSGKG
jgi:hypothetical protein